MWYSQETGFGYVESGGNITYSLQATLVFQLKIQWVEKQSHLVRESLFYYVKCKQLLCFIW